MTFHRTAPKLAAALAVLVALTALPASAAAPEARNITAQFVGDSLDVDRLQAFEVGGVVILRGRTYDRSAAEAAGLRALVLGYSRVANLIQVLEAPNDAAIQREAERELAMHRSLNGSQLSVESDKGMILLRGRVKHELQEEMAVAVLRNLDGVRGVRAELERE